MYEIFEHTADLGLRLHGPDAEHVFAEAGKALFDVLLANPEAIEPVDSMTFQVEAESLEDLFHDWLAELLFTFAAERIVFARFQVKIEQGRLEATGFGEPFAFEKHGAGFDVKAVTYHELKVEKTETGVNAQVILDI